LLKKINRHALHARKITFQHPSTQEEVAVSAPIPEDLTLIIQAMHLLNG
jgi:23S rRNA-/tRNA-specific pseudouridylate synthase